MKNKYEKILEKEFFPMTFKEIELYIGDITLNRIMNAMQSSYELGTKMSNKIQKSKSYREVNLSENIWIAGFKNAKECYKSTLETPNHLYSGKTSEIPKDLAEKCLSKSIKGLTGEKTYQDYNFDEYEECFSIEDSIETACSEPYCKIFKK